MIGTSSTTVSTGQAALRVVLCTCPAESATTIARALLEDRLVACVNIVSGVKSLYWWQNGITEDDEVMLVIKTTEDRWEALSARIPEVHPYDVPEIISLPVDGGAASYVSWVWDSTRN